MPSLRIISLLATIACAAFSNAAPVTPPAGVTNIGTPDVGNTVGGVDLQSVDTNFPGVPANIIQGYLAAVQPGDATATPPAQDGQHESIPMILTGVVDKLTPIVKDIRTAVTVDIQIDVLKDLIGQILTILSDAVDQVRALVADPSGGVLALGDRVLDIQEVAMIVAMPLYLIGTALLIVFSALSVVEFAVIAPLVGAVGVVVASLLAAVFALVVGLLSAVVPLVSGLVADLVTLNLGVVINVLGLSAS